MSKKKFFVSPMVIQEFQVQLEKDLLQRSVVLNSVMTSEGQGSASYFGSEDAGDPDADLIIEW